MSRPLFLANPKAWLITPRHGLTPAEYAVAIEGFRRFSLIRALWQRVTLRSNRHA